MSVQGHRVADFDSAKNPGDYFFAPSEVGAQQRLSFICPCGCGTLAGIKVNDDGQQIDGAWGWNRNIEKPTCTPSIKIFGPNQSSHWHGYLTDGVFAPC